VRATLATALLLTATACGSKPTSPTPDPGPTAAAPQITCSAPLAFTITGATTPVSFSTTVTDGTQPVTTACTPASGTAFPLGTTAVVCTATDASARQAACTFNVVVTGIQFGAKTFMAVGDSITAGENSLDGANISAPAFIDGPNAYPTKLLAHFNTDYPNQGIVVKNRGNSGDTSGVSLMKLAGLLSTDRPEAVLLLTGYNDMTGPCAVGADNAAGCDAAIDTIEINLRDLIRHSREYPTVRYVFVSTLTPSRPGRLAIDNSAIIDANDHVRLQAAAEGAFLVDSYSAFLGHESAYISTDGLHLNPAGYQAIADAFYAKIAATIPTAAPQTLFVR